MSTILISFGHDFEGCTYQLHPLSKHEIEEKFPAVQGVPSVFLGYETEADFEKLHGPLWKQVAMMLTGLTWEQIEEMGGMALFDPMNDRILNVSAGPPFTWMPFIREDTELRGYM